MGVGVERVCDSLFVFVDLANITKFKILMCVLFKRLEITRLSRFANDSISLESMLDNMDKNL